MDSSGEKIDMFVDCGLRMLEHNCQAQGLQRHEGKEDRKLSSQQPVEHISVNRVRSALQERMQDDRGN